LVCVAVALDEARRGRVREMKRGSNILCVVWYREEGVKRGDDFGW